MSERASPQLVELREAAAAYLARNGWTELVSHYIETRVADQFDVVLHIDHTRALEPLERTAVWEQGEAPDTYPFGI